MAVITVQCGNYANFVGAHFWNLQVIEFNYTHIDAVEAKLLVKAVDV